LRMNDLAREAGVGVGTVYRHFPTQRALAEALSAGTLDRMLTVARAAVAEVDASIAFFAFVRKALDLQLDDGGLQAVLVTPDHESDEVRETKREIRAAFRTARGGACRAPGRRSGPRTLRRRAAFGPAPLALVRRHGWTHHEDRAVVLKRLRVGSVWDDDGRPSTQREFTKSRASLGDH
jgi:AcrR family transcriptional regulator